MRPDVGDLVSARLPLARARDGGAYVIARVVARRGRELVVVPVTGRRRVRVPVELVDGWWPKGARDRSGAAMRSPEAKP